MSKQSYKPGEHPDLPPPASVIGPFAWVRKNFFSTPTNAIITLLGCWFLIESVPGVLDWLFFDAVYTAEDRYECRARAAGACWAVITERFSLFAYGFYPEAERWRVNLSFFLLIFTLAPILFERVPYRRYALHIAVAFPFVAAWLLVGGIGLAHVETDQFGGFMLTFVIGITGIGFSFPLGILLALGRQSRLRIIQILSIGFIEFIRGVPLIALLFVASTMLNYFLPPGVTFDLLLRVLIMVTLFASAYMAEVIRGGLQSIPKGQFEAADSMGLHYWSSMRLIILPQALKVSIPGIVNTFIGLYKDTTLVVIIGLFDPLGIGRASLADTRWTGLSTEVYLFVAIFFFISCFAMARYSLYLEKKLKTDYRK